MGKVRYTVDEQQTITEIHSIVVHRFVINEIEDPDIRAALPIWDWQNSDAGKFVMEHAVDQPVFHKQLDPMSLGYRYAIVAELEKKKLSEFLLKFGPIK